MRRSRIVAVVGVNAVVAFSLLGPNDVSGARTAAPAPFLTSERPFLVPHEGS